MHIFSPETTKTVQREPDRLIKGFPPPAEDQLCQESKEEGEMKDMDERQRKERRKMVVYTVNA